MLLLFPGIVKAVNFDSLIQISKELAFKAPDAAYETARNAYTHALQNNDKPKQAEVLHIFGTILTVKGELDSAQILYQQSLEISEAEGLHELMSRSFSNLGLVYHEQGAVDEALKYYYKSLLIEEQSGNLLGVNGSRINIARVYVFQKDYQKALVMYDSAYDYFQNENHLQGMSVCLNNKGYIYQELKDYDRALTLYQRALPLAEEAGDLYSVASRLNNLGRLYYLKDNTEEAIRLFEKAVGVASGIDDKKNLNHSYLGLSKLWLDEGQPDKALSYANQSLELANHTGSLLEIQESYELLQEIFSRNNQYQKAYEALKQQKLYSDSLINLEKDKELNRLQLVKKENENQSLQDEKLLQARQLQIQMMQINNKNLLIGASTIIMLLGLFAIIILYRGKRDKQQANLQLIKQNQEIYYQKEVLARHKKLLEEQKEQLSRLNDLKDKTLSVISHDFKSPLNMIQSVLDLYQDKILNEQELIENIPKISEYVQLTKTLLDDLLTWARKQFTDFEIIKIPVNSLRTIRYVLEQLQPFLNERNISVQVDVHDDPIVYSEEEIVKIILRNLISNAIKYSPNDSKITISHREEENLHWISVTDQGSGISQEAIDNILSNRIMKEAKESQSAGIGIFISKQFIEANGGKLTVNSVQGNGTTFSIALPKPQLMVSHHN